MKILFLSHYFPPEVNAPASRTYEHCKQWAKNGHDVTVVTCAPNHPGGVVYEGFKNQVFYREAIDGINVVRIITYVTANEGFLKRTLNYISFMISCIIFAPFLPKVDIVLSTSPQFFNGLAGYVVSRIKRVPWVLEIRDLWPESIVAVGAIRNKTLIRILEYLEMFAYRKADRVVPVTDSFREYMVNKGINAERIDVIKNGVDLGFYNEVSIDLSDNSQFIDNKTNQLLKDLQGKFVASYVGTHGMAHHLETVLEAADLIKTNKDIIFLMVGSGAEKDILSELSRNMQLDNVIMLDQQPKSMMPLIWKISDVSLVLLKKSNLFKTVIPSKIFESMAMRKPIVMGVEGEAKKIIEEAGSGLCIEPENAQQLAETLVKLKSDKASYDAMGSNGREYVEKYFDRTILAGKYLSLLEELVNSR